MITIEEMAGIIAGSKRKIFVKLVPDDSLTEVDDIDDAMCRIHRDYRDHVVGFERTWHDWGYDPVFEPETQARWDAAMKQFFTDKTNFVRRNWS